MVSSFLMQMRFLLYKLIVGVSGHPVNALLCYDNKRSNPMIRRRNMEQIKTFGAAGDDNKVGELGARFCGRLPYGIMIDSFGFVD
jgi:hypothetical protein